MQDPEADAAAAQAAATKRRQKQTKAKAGTSGGSTQGEETSGSDAQEPRLPLTELVSRFTLATNELQLMGIVKPADRKKRGAFARRLVWAPPRPV